MFQPFLQKLEEQGSAATTLKWYRNHLSHFEKHLAGKPLGEITDTDVYTFRDLHEDKHTQYNALRCVKRFFKFHNIDLGIVLPKYTERPVEEYQPKELQAFFAACTPEEMRLWMFFRCTGVREGEASHAVWENLLRHEYVVQPYGDWNPKKFKTRRIPIPDKLWNLLEPHRGTGLMFPNIHGKSEGHFYRKLKWVAIRAGLDRNNWWLHKWRSTFATTMLRNGAAPHEVAAWLGHGDLSTVMRYLALVNNGSDRVRGLANGAFN